MNANEEETDEMIGSLICFCFKQDRDLSPKHRNMVKKEHENRNTFIFDGNNWIENRVLVFFARIFTDV